MNRNKYKLVKNRPPPNRQVQHNQGSSTNFSQFPASSSTIPPSSSLPPNQSFKLINKNSTNQTILSQSVESSNKLDELLKRCREIGKSSSTTTTSQPCTSIDSVSSSSSGPSTSTNFHSNSFHSKITSNPITRKSNLISNSKYKLSRVNPISTNKPTTDSIGLKKLTPNKKVVSKFKLINNASDIKPTRTSTFKGFLYPRIYYPVLKSNISGKISKKYKYKKKETLKQIHRYKLVNKSFKTPHILNIRGYQFKLAKNQKKLSRIGRVSSPKKQNFVSKHASKFKFNNSPERFKYFKAVNDNNEVMRKDLNRLILANNLINRSIMTINRTYSIKQQKETGTTKTSDNNKCKLDNTKKYCLFYNRFGRCSRGDSCPYTHDPKRVALCPRFLRGTCKVENCPYSHNASAEKTPLCSFFAAGCCNRENCPYSHVYFGKDAQFCLEFARGYCSLGSKCNKAHISECPDYSQNNKCSRGSKCPLVHRKKTKSEKKANVNSQINSENDTKDSNRISYEKATPNSDFGAAYISINSKSTDNMSSTNNETDGYKKDEINEGLKLRPSFAIKTKSSSK